MNLTYRIKSFVEVLEDYKIGLEEHLYERFGEREKYIAPEHIRENDADGNFPFLIQKYEMTREELVEIRNEIGRVRLFIDVFTKLLIEPLN
jgi:hypothetical protein